jgi:hypothetical protein
MERNISLQYSYLLIIGHYVRNMGPEESYLFKIYFTIIYQQSTKSEQNVLYTCFFSNKSADSFVSNYSCPHLAVFENRVHLSWLILSLNIIFSENFCLQTKDLCLLMIRTQITELVYSHNEGHNDHKNISINLVVCRTHTNV